MALPTFSMRQLLEAGVHFGHHTRRWNPKMSPYLFGVRNNTHIIDLQQTVPMLYQALQAVRDVAANGGRVLFVGTKRQASPVIAEAAQRCGMYFVQHRWLGGMLTNWRTISNSIKRLKDLEQQLGEEDLGLTKKELLQLTRERDKLNRALGGIKDMGAPPDILVIIDTNKESLAVHEANKLGLPVVAVIDSNCDPEGIDYPVPGNDDSLRAIELYCQLLSDAVLDGLQEEAMATGQDVGAQEEAPREDLAEPAAAVVAEVGPEAAAEQAPAAESKADEAKADEAKADEAKADEAKAEEGKAEAQPAEGEKAEAADDAKADDAKADDAKADEPKADETKAADTAAKAE